MNEKKDFEEKNRSIFTLISFSLAGFSQGATFSFITAYAIYFYEVEIGLSIVLITLAFSIFALWDAINDPLVGYLSDKPRFYTKRLGRRFPWIFFGMIPISILFFFLFAPPNIDPVENSIFLFFWLTIFLCALEWFSTAVLINWESLYPQKFRTDRDRRYATGFILLINTCVYFCGIVLPPLFIVYGDKSSFLTAGLIIILISFPALIISIPGIREDKEMIEKVLRRGEQGEEKGNYFRTMKKLVKNRNFLAIIAVYIPINTYGILTLGSVIYYTRYVLQLDVIYSSLVMAGYLISGVIGIPVWVWLAGKKGEIRVAYISAIGMILSLLPILLFVDLTWAIVGAVAASFFGTGWNCADQPLFATVLDQVVVQERRRIEGVYNGVLVFFLKASTPIAVFIFSISHSLTGFDPAADIQTPLAQWGIIANISLVPMIIGGIGILLFNRLWNITPEQIKSIRAQLKELDL